MSVTANHGVDVWLRSPATSCPQCGAAVSIPVDYESAVCHACGSSLTRLGGVLVQVATERVDVTRDQAEACLRAWISETEVPQIAMGELRFFPFLKIFRANGEENFPLAALASPWVAELRHAPGQMVEIAPASQPRDGSSPALVTAVLDSTLVKASFAQAMADRSVSKVLIEYRAYYPAQYSAGVTDRRSRIAIVSAGRGVVYGEKLVGRRRTVRDQGVFLGLAVLLLAEAAFTPGLYPRLIALLVTVLVAFAALTRTAAVCGG